MAKPTKKTSQALESTQEALDMSAEDPTPQPESIAVPRQSRLFKGDQILDHDLFKLEPAKMRKNVSYQEDDPIYEYFEHSHIFHTIDSSGRRQTMSAPVGGHFHNVQVLPNGSDVPTISVSPAMQWVKKKVGKKVVVVAAEIDGDSHTHAAQYLGSEKIQLRKTNVEFAKFEAAFKARQEISVEGIISK